VVTDPGPDRDPDRRPPLPEGGYVLALPGMLACGRCAALLLDHPHARDVHDGHHAALKELWRRANGRGGGG
jgi:hypothetical protein